MGIFKVVQALYAGHNVAVFPVDGDSKKPAVLHPQKLGLAASRALVPKFSNCDALGFWAGRRNKITVLDVDIPGEAGERTLADRMARHGQSPLIVRSAGRKFHAYYRHGGEGRTIHHDDEAVDVLGSGMVIAPPSRVATGRYEIIQGSLDDLDRLPPMQRLAPEAAGLSPSNDRARGCIREGRRATALWRHCMRQARHCDDLEALLDVARTFNENALLPPLPDAEVVHAAQSAWDKTERGENWFRAAGIVPVAHADVDGLMMEAPDAWMLPVILRRHHWSRACFIIANAMAASMPGGGWGLPRFRAARDELVKRGIIRCRHPGGRGRHDPPCHEWTTPMPGIGVTPAGSSFPLRLRTHNQ